MSNLLGNVFRSGQKTSLCTLQVETDAILATPKNSEDSSAPFRFPLRGEFLSFGGDGGTQVVLKNSEGATLYTERGPIEAHLESCGDRAFQDRIKSEGKRVVRSSRLSLVAFFGFFLGCGLLALGVLFFLNWSVDRMVDQIPISWEESLGDLVVEGGGMGAELQDPRIVEPVQKIIDRIAAAEVGQPYTLKLHVVENEMVNAFAAPGGHIVVFTGLLEKTESPDELAGVLAHEFQHVFQRHGLRNMVHSVKWQILASMLLGDVGSVQQVLVGKAPQFLSLSYGRSLEEEADMEGVKLLVKAHANPQGMVDFFEIMKANEAGIVIPEFMSSHPETQKRIENLEEWISENPASGFEEFDVDWSALKEALGEDETSGSLESGALSCDHFLCNRGVSLRVAKL